MIKKRQKRPPHTECVLPCNRSYGSAHSHKLKGKQTEFAIKLFAYRAENWVVFVSRKRSLMYGVCVQLFNVSNQSVALTCFAIVECTLGISLSLWLPPAEWKRRWVHISSKARNSFLFIHINTLRNYTEPGHISCQPN